VQAPVEVEDGKFCYCSFLLALSDLCIVLSDPVSNKTPNPTNRKKKAPKPTKTVKRKKKGDEVVDGPQEVENPEENKDSDDDEGEKRSRAPNYLDNEDLQLCTTWLEMTEDGRKGTDQTGEAFWDSITTHYNLHIDDPKRSKKSLKNHWSLIQAAINKFHGCVNQINHQNPSGTTVSNRISMALSLYAKLNNNKPFAYLSCYDLLSKAPKWHEYNTSMDKKNESKNGQ
jgi:hypothetical protein